jgi:flagellar biosynthetic protein FlhB
MDERGDKTEQPTPRARERARERGDIPHSTELSSTGILLIGFLAMLLMMGTWMNISKEFFTTCFGFIRFNDLDGPTVGALFRYAIDISLRLVWPVFTAIVVGGLFFNFIQTKGNISAEKIKPSLQRLNPVTNTKNLFSMRRLVEAAKSIIKITLAAVIGYSVIKGKLGIITIAGLKGPAHYVSTFGMIAFEIGIKLILAFLVLAIFDYMYQRYEHEKKMKMTRHEV